MILEFECSDQIFSRVLCCESLCTRNECYLIAVQYATRFDICFNVCVVVGSRYLVRAWTGKESRVCYGLRHRDTVLQIHSYMHYRKARNSAEYGQQFSRNTARMR